MVLAALGAMREDDERRVYVRGLPRNKGGDRCNTHECNAPRFWNGWDTFRGVPHSFAVRNWRYRVPSTILFSA